jgi:hypothetical protein
LLLLFHIDRPRIVLRDGDFLRQEACDRARVTGAISNSAYQAVVAYLAHDGIPERTFDAEETVYLLATCSVVPSPISEPWIH